MPRRDRTVWNGVIFATAPPAPTHLGPPLPPELAIAMSKDEGPAPGAPPPALPPLPPPSPGTHAIAYFRQQGWDLNELVHVKYAPSGDVWASFLKEMCVKLSTSHCSWNYGAHVNSVFQGGVGRLVHTK